MKTSNHISKSKVMKAAWTIFRKYTKQTMANWSKALKRAWKWAKESLGTAKVFDLYYEHVMKETDKAVQVKVDTKIASGCYSSKFIWIPKSLISSSDRDTFELPIWFGMKLVDKGQLNRIDVLA